MSDPIIPFLSSRIAACPAEHDPVRYPYDILCTEQASTRILRLNSNSDWRDASSIVWSWCPASDPAIPKEHLVWFECLSECKLVNGGKSVLVTASGGAVTMVDVATRSAVFNGYAGGNTHSAELLPDGNLVSVSSSGNFIALFPNLGKPHAENIPIRYPHEDAHGILWDPEEQLLWVLGRSELAAYQYNFDRMRPALHKVESIALPPFALNGHDMARVLPDSRFLFLTGVSLSLLDLNSRSISLLAPIPHLKSISLSGYEPSAKLVAQVPTESWWSDSLRCLDAERSLIGTLPHARFYKARWWR